MKSVKMYIVMLLGGVVGSSACLGVLLVRNEKDPVAVIFGLTCGVIANLGAWLLSKSKMNQ